MPLSRRLARLNKVGLNRVMRNAAPWLPGFGVVVHRGRKSGSEFRTPVNVFERPDGYLFALTYGSDSDWVRNVVAAGSCDLVVKGRTVHLTAPRVFRDPSRQGIPMPARAVLARIDVTEFLHLDRA